MNPAPLRDGSPLRLDVTLSGDTAASIRAIAYVTGQTESQVLAALASGSDDRADHPGELFGEIFCEGSGPVPECAERFKAYRDRNGIDYPDFVFEAQMAEERDEIDHDECVRRIEAGRLLNASACAEEGGAR